MILALSMLVFTLMPMSDPSVAVPKVRPLKVKTYAAAGRAAVLVKMKVVGEVGCVAAKV